MNVIFVVTEEFLVQQEIRAKSLITNLAKAIKELQLQHAEMNEENPIIDCQATERLCNWFEHILQHGYKARYR